MCGMPRCATRGKLAVHAGCLRCRGLENATMEDGAPGVGMGSWNVGDRLAKLQSLGGIGVSISIRDTLPDDLPEIFRIQNDPLVQPYQYRRWSHETIEASTDVHNGNDISRGVVFRNSTILLGNPILND